MAAKLVPKQIYQYGNLIENTVRKEKKKVVAHVMKRVAAGAHLPTLWLFEPGKRPDDRADYCLGTRR